LITDFNNFSTWVIGIKDGIGKTILQFLNLFGLKSEGNESWLVMMMLLGKILRWHKKQNCEDASKKFCNYPSPKSLQPTKTQFDGSAKYNSWGRFTLSGFKNGSQLYYW